MARIVPAKPACTEMSEEGAILELERGLDDNYVLLQRSPLPGCVLVIHPIHGLCALACASGLRTFDPDAEAWDAGDPDDTARAMARALGPLAGVPVAGAAWFPDTPAPAHGHPRQARVAFQGQGGSLGQLIGEAMKMSAALSADAVDALIRSVSATASGYVPGQITDAQRRWRETRDEDVVGVQSGLHGQDGSQAAPSVESGPATPSTPASDQTPTAAEVAQATVGSVVAVMLEPAAATVISESASAGKPGVPPLDGPDITVDDPLILLLRQAAENIAAQRPIFVLGVQIDPEEMVSPDFLLPALLISAAQDWAPVVVSKEGRGGFLMRLRTDPDAILGYRVAALEPSAPLLLMLPVVDRIRRSAKVGANGEEVLNMDETVQVFARWLMENKLDADLIENVDMRIALKND